MRLFRVLRTLSALVCLTAVPALAQYTLKKIVFQGATPYTQTALEAASGLKPGDKANNDTLQQAAQRLSDTGAFGDLQVSFDGPVNAISIIFKITRLDSIAGSIQNSQNSTRSRATTLAHMLDEVLEDRKVG
jgi:outer membrane protein assembly factor BamA